MALRQVTWFVEKLLRPVGFDWAVPELSTLSHCQKILAVNIPYRGTKAPLHLLIDSTGIKVEGERHPHKHGGPAARSILVSTSAAIQFGIGDIASGRCLPRRSENAASRE